MIKKKKKILNKERAIASEFQVESIEIDESEPNNMIDITPDNTIKQTLTKLRSKSSTTKSTIHQIKRILLKESISY